MSDTREFHSDLTVQIGLALDWRGGRLLVSYRPNALILEPASLRAWLQGCGSGDLSPEELAALLADWLIEVLHPAGLEVELAWPDPSGVGCSIGILGGE